MDEIVRAIVAKALAERGFSEIPWPKEPAVFGRTLVARVCTRGDREIRRAATDVAAALIDRMVEKGATSVAYLTPPTAFHVGEGSCDVALDCGFSNGTIWIDPDPGPDYTGPEPVIERGRYGEWIREGTGEWLRERITSAR